MAKFKKNMKDNASNIFTFGNLICGVLSIIMSVDGFFTCACFFVFMSAFFDRYDGKIARYFGVEGTFGKELDSLADLISFGTAPAILSYVVLRSSIGFYATIPAILFVCAGALRLARYNSSIFNNIFTGVPITAAGAFLSFYLLMHFLTKKSVSVVFTVVLMVLLAYCMISKRIKIKKM